MTTAHAALGLFCVWLTIFAVALAVSGCATNVARETDGWSAEITDHRIDKKHEWTE